MSPVMRAAMLRLGITFVVSVVFAIAISEISYQLVKDKGDRLPQQIEIVIPAGTAAAIARGEPGPSLPEMTFVQGDSIKVTNQDQIAHQLGPLWVPPGTSSVMNLDQPNQYTLECSFQPNRSLGIDVIARARPSDRVFGIFTVGAPTWILSFLFSLVGIPLPGSEEQPAA